MQFLTKKFNLPLSKRLAYLAAGTFLIVAIPITVLATLNFRSVSPQAATTPNDPCFVSGCPGFANSQQWALNKINAPNAWDITQGNTNIKVAIISTGVVTTLTDLQGQLAPGYNAISPGSSTTDDFGTYGNGTAVAGIIGAVTNNSTDMAGVAWRVKMLPVKVCDQTGTCPNAVIAAGINWAVTNGVQVMNIGPSLNPTLASPDIDAAISNAISQGVIIIASAGNFSGYLGYPANLSGVIAVGSTDSTDSIASFSGRGSQLSLVAPGVSVYSLARQGCCSSFTSSEFASSHVAGAAVLLLAAGVPASQVKISLTQGAKDLGTIGYDSTYGNGRLDICGALNAAGKICPVGSSSKPGDINGDNSVNLTDLNLLINNWGTTYAAADLNKSGKVDLGDLTILINNWGR